MASLPPEDLVAELAGVVGSRLCDHVLRLGIDGPDAAGKTTLADSLAARLADGRPVVRASIDGFHLPRAVRHRRGRLSPEGYYQDSFDHDAVRRVLLEPLGPGGDRRYRRAVFDHRTDTAVAAPAEVAPSGAVLLFDGVFLHRPELREHWDLRVYVTVGPAEAVRRALLRDAELLGGPAAVRQRYQHRYLPGQQLYWDRCAPVEHADLVIDNDNPTRPGIIKWCTEAGAGREADERAGRGR